MKKSNYSHTKKGMTLIETSIVLIVAAIVLGGVFMIAPKIMAGSKADTAAQSFVGLSSALENVKVNNAGAYPAAAAGAISANVALATELGGASAMKDLVGWTYACTAGSGTTATIVTTSFESAEIRDSVLQKINGRYAPWSAAASGTNALTITKAGTTCQ